MALQDHGRRRKDTHHSALKWQEKHVWQFYYHFILFLAMRSVTVNLFLLQFKNGWRRSFLLPVHFPHNLQDNVIVNSATMKYFPRGNHMGFMALLRLRRNCAKIPYTILLSIRLCCVLPWLNNAIMRRCTWQKGTQLQTRSNFPFEQ